MPLLWGVFASNAAVLAIATMLLALTPATLSSPVAVTEAIALAGGWPPCWRWISCSCGVHWGRSIGWESVPTP